jgi:hypothetical protein
MNKTASRKMKEMEPVESVDVEGLGVCLAAMDGQEHFLVHAKDLHPAVPRGSVICVDRGTATSKPGELFLAADHGRTVVARHGEARGLFLIGRIDSVEYWPGRAVRKSED